MGEYNKILKILTVFTLSVGISLPGVISVHAEDETPQPTISAEPESASAPSEETAVTPEATATPETTSSPEISAEPVATSAPSEEEAATSEPAATPSATPESTPSATPAPKPTPTPAPKDPNDTSSDGASAIQMFRVYNPNSGEHFYTSNAGERDRLRSLGWRYEGVGWVAPSKGKPVYRLYNPNAGDHFYTLSTKERDHLVSLGWRSEGTGWYSDTKQRAKVYRDYNPNKFSCNHNYTSNVYEHGALIQLGWRNEDVAFYAMQKGWERHYNHGNVPYYNQGDPRWGNQRYGGMTLRNTGCGVTSISMIVSSLAGTVLPPQMAQYLYSVGQFNNPRREPGTYGTSRIAAAQHWGLQVERITTLEQFRTALRLGKVVSEITENSFANGSHGIVVIGKADGNAVAYDPFNSGHNGTYSVDYLWRARAYSPINYDAGAVIFAFYKD